MSTRRDDDIPADARGLGQVALPSTGPLRQPPEQGPGAPVILILSLIITCIVMLAYFLGVEVGKSRH